MDIHRCRFVDYTPHTITSLAFSHESTLKFTPLDLRVAVGRANGDIEIWNPRYNWIHEQTLQGGKGRSVEGLVWSLWEDSVPRLFSIGGSTIITEWDLSTGLPLKNYDCNAGVIWSISINQKGDKLAVGCDDGTVVIVDVSGGPGSLEHDSILQRQDSRILSITWYNDEYVIGGCADGRVKIWSVQGDNKNRLVSNLRVDKSKTESTLVWSVLALPKKNQLVTGDSTGSIKFWNVQHFVLQQSFQVHEADVLCLLTDLQQEKIFSAGIDRKIFNFNLVGSNDETSKWINSSNRLLHSNDIRALASFESKGSNFLLSGGVERSIVINSVNNFHDGPYRKLPIVLQKPNVITNSSKKLIIMWQDQVIKVWKINELDRSKKLIAKLSLADDENITSCSIDKSGTFLVVGRLINIKIFRLRELEEGVYKINKLRIPALENYGSKMLSITDSKILNVTPENELISFDYELVDDSIIIGDSFEYELPEELKTRSKIPYLQKINNLKLSDNGDVLAITRLNGSVEIIDLTKQESHRLIKLNRAPVQIDFTKQNTLVLITCENKLYEFNITAQSLKKQDILTSWSKRNSDYLPSKFLKLTSQCQGFFRDNLNERRIWLFGDNWLCFFDLSFNIPIDESKYGNGSSKNQQQLQQQQQRRFNKKRRRNSSVVMTISETTNTVDDSLNVEFMDEGYGSDVENGDDEVDIVENIDNKLNKNLRDLEINRMLKNGIVQKEDEDERCFWFTNKYRSLMLADVFGYNEIIVIERPLFLLPTPPAFKLNKIIV